MHNLKTLPKLTLCSKHYATPHSDLGTNANNIFFSNPRTQTQERHQAVIYIQHAKNKNDVLVVVGDRVYKTIQKMVSSRSYLCYL